MSPTSICASCLRTARQTAARTKLSPRLLRNHSSRTSHISPATSQQPLELDFLAPSALRAPPYASLRRISESSYFTKPSIPATRSFSTSPLRAAEARAIQNARTDKSGNPMTISVSPRACDRLHKISIADKKPLTALRVAVESGGCHGFQYLMSLTDLKKTPPTEEDTVFEGDKGAKVVIDQASLELLKGSTVDYTIELIGSQFKVTGIPGATSSCGCGTSFDIKLD